MFYTILMSRPTRLILPVTMDLALSVGRLLQFVSGGCSCQPPLPVHFFVPLYVAYLASDTEVSPRGGGSSPYVMEGNWKEIPKKVTLG